MSAPWSGRGPRSGKAGTGSRSPALPTARYHAIYNLVPQKISFEDLSLTNHPSPQPSSPHHPIYRFSDTSMNTPDPFFLNDAWAQEAGIELLEVSAGRAKVRLRIAGWHKNSHGTVHGGAIFTLADTAFALASNSHGIPAAAINAHISFVKAATSGTLYAVAEEFSVNPKIATYTVTVTDDHGEKIALFLGMVYRKTPGG
jgi:acyl-CoA thioesterase